MVQNNTVLSGNMPKWGQYPVGVFPGCNAKTLRGMCFASAVGVQHVYKRQLRKEEVGQSVRRSVGDSCLKWVLNSESWDWKV